MQNFNLEKWIIINSNETITIEEEKEILDLAKQVLRRKNENRKVFLLEDIDFIAKNQAYSLMSVLAKIHKDEVKPNSSHD